MEPRDDRAFVAVIKSEMSGLSVEAKYLLARIVLRFGSDPIEVTLSELQRQLEISRSVLIRSRDELLASRYLDDRPVPGRALGSVTMLRGRPRRGFKLNRSFAEEVASDARQATMPPQSTLEIIKWVMAAPKMGPEKVSVQGSPKKPRGRPKGNNHLLVPGRLLLAVLWAVADGQGLVRDASPARLTKLTGMSRRRISHQLGHLDKLGYLSYRIGPVAGRLALAGLPEAVVLNGKTRAFGGRAKVTSKEIPLLESGFAFLIDAYAGADRAEGSKSPGLAVRKSLDFERSAYLGLKSDDPVRKVLDKAAPWGLQKVFAGDSSKGHARRYLGFKACDYASDLINHHKAALESQGRVSVVAALRNRIEVELFGGDELRKNETEEFINALGMWTYAHVFDMAQRTLESLARYEGLAYRELLPMVGSAYSNFLLVPSLLEGMAYLNYEYDASKANGVL